MAAKTLFVEFRSRTPAAFAEGDDGLFGGIAFVFVGRPMAGLATIFALPCLGMIGGVETSRCLVVTTDTDHLFSAAIAAGVENRPRAPALISTKAQLDRNNSFGNDLCIGSPPFFKWYKFEHCLFSLSSRSKNPYSV